MEESAITAFIPGLKAGDAAAIDKIVDHYLVRIARVVESRLPSHVRRVSDGEDIALSTMHSVVRRAGAGQFGQLETGDDLWRLIVAIGLRKAASRCVRESAQKRGGGMTRGESDGLPASTGGLDYVADHGPAPDRIVEENEFSDRVLEFLNGLDETLSHVAVAKCQGLSNEQIGRLLDCSTKTVERKLKRLRENVEDWAKES